VFTEDQANQGQVLYEENCSRCHRDTLFGGEQPLPLIMDRFMNRWREESLEPLFATMKSTMPKDTGPGQLTDTEYLNVLAYVLKANRFPPGNRELKIAELASIQLVGMDGPQPLPTNAAIQAVGCLTPGANKTWELTNATSFARTRQLTESAPEESKAAAAVQPGSRNVPLQILEDSGPAARVDSYAGHRVHVKGVLNRRNNVERINVTWFETLSSTCAP
jgi:hypothetical protein